MSWINCQKNKHNPDAISATAIIQSDMKKVCDRPVLRSIAQASYEEFRFGEGVADPMERRTQILQRVIGKLPDDPSLLTVHALCYVESVRRFAKVLDERGNQLWTGEESNVDSVLKHCVAKLQKDAEGPLPVRSFGLFLENGTRLEPGAKICLGVTAFLKRVDGGVEAGSPMRVAKDTGNDINASGKIFKTLYFCCNTANPRLRSLFWQEYKPKHPEQGFAFVPLQFMINLFSRKPGINLTIPPKYSNRRQMPYSSSPGQPEGMFAVVRPGLVVRTVVDGGVVQQERILDIPESYDGRKRGRSADVPETVDEDPKVEQLAKDLRAARAMSAQACLELQGRIQRFLQSCLEEKIRLETTSVDLGH